MDCSCKRGVKDGLIIGLIIGGWVGGCCRVSLPLELLFLRQTLKTFLLGYFGDVAPCQWGRIAVVGRAGDGCDPSGCGRLMLW